MKSYMYGVNLENYQRFKSAGLPGTLCVRTCGVKGKKYPLADEFRENGDEPVRVYFWLFPSASPKGGGIMARGVLGKACVLGEARGNVRIKLPEVTAGCVWVEQVEWRSLQPIPPEYIARKQVVLPPLTQATTIVAIESDVVTSLDALW